MALTKAELAEALFEQLGMSKRDAKDTVEVFFEEIRKALESGEQVNSPVLVILTYEIKMNVRVETLKPVKIFLLPLDVS